MQTAELEVEENGRQKSDESKKNKDETKSCIEGRKSKERGSMAAPSSHRLFHFNY